MVRDLHKVNRNIYWADFLMSAASGWTAFICAVRSPLLSWQMLLAGMVAMFCLYRGLCFIHEISHQNSRTLPGFETAYNLLVGFPFLMPSFTYVGVHQSHHKLATYGTAQDPEYLPFAQSWVMSSAFALQAFLIPVFLLLRFLLLAPLGLMVPEFQRWLATRASSLTMNVRYRRDLSAALMRKLNRDSVLIFLLWATFLCLMSRGIVPARAFGLWLVVSSVAGFINSVRTLGAHAYESDGQQLDRTGQLRDSIDTPGAFWTELWAPVGLRYHALHHYFPGIPYHNLAEAYRRLSVDNGSRDYCMMSSSSLLHSLHDLLRKGAQRR
jgi:fatty acid desaturase